MKCSECGTENAENANLCEKCGKKLPELQVPEKHVTSPKTSKSRIKSKLLILIVCIIAVVGIVGIIGFVGTMGLAPAHSSTEWNVMVGESMEPSIYRGDIVMVDNDTTNIQVGDIIVYNATWVHANLIHRVIAIDKSKNGTTYFIAKGDNIPVQDPEPIYQNQIISKAVMSNGKPVVMPKIGYISLWIRGL